jgi:Ni,Fe-hydrogenase I large subunit
MPHQCAVAAGGVTTQVTLDKITSALTYAREAAEFIERCYLPDVLMLARAYPDCLEIGKGCSRFLSYGVFAAAAGKPLFAAGLTDEAGQWRAFSADKITEDVKNSYYADECDNLHPSAGQTVPAPAKPGAYSWLKAPRYDAEPCEVGPLARMMVTYAAGSPDVKGAVDVLCRKVGIQPAALNSTLGRHAARALEASILARKLQEWILKLQPGEPCVTKVEVPQQGRGAGLIDGPRGALGHWITIDGGKVANYQAVVPTTWNGSPRDSRGVPGPIEQALETQAIHDLDNPFEVVRTIRSFDPCLACAVHVARRKGSEVRIAQVCERPAPQ